jgi:hypothetical protein
MLLLLTVRNSKAWHQSGLQWQNVHTKFCENWPTASKAKTVHMDRQTDSTVISGDSWQMAKNVPLHSVADMLQ